MLQGGYPRIYDTRMPLNLFFSNYIDTYIERDVSEYLMIIVVSCFWLYSKVFHFWETCRLPSFFTRHLQAPKNNLDCPHRPTTTGRSMMLIRDLPPTIGARTHTVYPRGSQ